MEKEKKSFKFTKLIWPGINPQFKNYILSEFEKIISFLNEILKLIDNEHKIYSQKFTDVLKDLENTKLNLEKYMNSIKSYTEDGKIAFQNIYSEIVSLSNNIQFIVENYTKSKKELYLLNIITEIESFQAKIYNNFNKIQHPDFRYTLSSIIGLAFVFIPFLNIISLLLGLFLISRKDWRAIIIGIIILVLFFIQAINVIFLAF